MKTSPPVKLRASHRNQGTQDRDPFRASCEAAGVTLAPMDMMIAAHAKAVDAISSQGIARSYIFPTG